MERSCFKLPCTACFFAALFFSAVGSADVVSFSLINTDNNTPIAAHDPLQDGAEIDLSNLPTQNLSIRANVNASVGSVSFDLTGQQLHQQTESVAPYALFGDTDGNFNPWEPASPPASGNYQLSARSHSESGAGGTPGTELSIAISVVNDSGGGGNDGDGSVSISGDARQWHKITLSQAAIASSETATPNPFLDYRFNVRFIAPDGRELIVPGYFAGDGSGGAAGNLWQAHLAPDMRGNWDYQISFRSGSEVAVELGETAGNAVVPYDGVSGSFTVTDSNKSAPDFRAPEHGLIKNRGSHYLSFASGKLFVKGGPDIPENMFGYDGFDNTPNAGHSFTAHVSDWNAGDPDWNGGAGRGLIGALNFIAERGANSIYFLPMNIGGDGNDTFPTIAEFDKTRYDLSKLAQWEIAFQHAQTKGIWLHFVLAETEAANENYHDNGNLGPQRKLYYRMLTALFGHHNGLQFNLGEENDYGTAKRVEFAAWIKAIDPYDHPVTTHTNNNQFDQFYTPLLGNSDFDITSFQGNPSRNSMFDLIAQWRADSASAGVPWVISFDEPQKIENNMDNGVGYPHGRRDKMWPVYMAGGGGFEWYVQQDGGGHSLDQQIDDFNIMADALNWTGHALDFLSLLPLQQMSSNRTQASSAEGGNTYTRALSGTAYAIYNDRNGGPISIDLSDVPATAVFTVSWFNPRNGDLLPGTVATVTGGGMAELGSAPNQTGQDWAVLLVGDEDFLFADGFEPIGSTAPVFDPPPGNQISNEGDTISLQINVSDPDNSAALSYAASNLPPDLSINASSGLISGNIASGTAQQGFIEADNLLVIEMESGTPLPANWPLQNGGFPSATGAGYLRYTGSNQFNNPGVDIIEYPIIINNPGTYRLQWRSIVGNGSDTTEHNDSWLKINADAFFAEKNGNILCPKGFNPATNDCSGGQPNGSGSAGWFKVYRSGGTASSWSWSTNTSDNDAHQIFARFDQVGQYSIQISGRSTDHVIDRLVMFQPPVSSNTATSVSNPESAFGSGAGAAANSPYAVEISVSDEATTTMSNFVWTVNKQ
ncbi:MAG: hypothetical protein Tsb0027_12280 [Wenzhouxiangellaceae bacterium]